ncbi:AAA family ATPase [Variovorax sp. PDNC026]|uniref:AAA family ATPase n=1 Tax=Variovorax sp. PDNC026 TaxID=2811425 RepID=UPI00196378C7|nr:AAA family ATPase [Variovorax sp. PDNC026]QRY30566.1 AAA family ATPase [Variovorax sp. PDNC026]
MHVRHITISNYKSFGGAQVLNFDKGFNLILGGNNAGKSTVLETLDLLARNEPHRSRVTVPRYGDPIRGFSKIAVGLTMSTLELGRMHGREQFYVPINVPVTDPGVSGLAFRQFDSDVLLNFDFVVDGGSRRVELTSKSIFNGGFLDGESEPRPSAEFIFNAEGEFEVRRALAVADGSRLQNLANRCLARIYRFGAQRRPGSECGMVDAAVLDREAATLPYFINRLQTSNAHGHRQLCSWVNRILPTVAWVQSTPTGRNSFALQCLPEAPEAQREDLATPLASMGTGIGNIVAILYVMLTAREPQVIAIDEPNAFLHPRALRELLAILESEGKQHQFILTAHSADVLTAVDTSSINFLELASSATVVKRVSREQLHSIRGELAELGISVTDLHGKDRVLWVEGQTEELVFPLLLRYACPEIAAGTAVLRVERTGTFERKRGVAVEEIVSIYDRLSKSAGLVPPMICMLLDAETKKPNEMAQIERDSQNRLRFLDRRMLENYLLNPRAIHAALLELNCACELAQVENELSTINLTDISNVDGARVLQTLFSSISEATQEFRKTRDVPNIVSWLIANERDFLEPLRSLLRRILMNEAAFTELER